jgi:hypothetical protein
MNKCKDANVLVTGGNTHIGVEPVTSSVGREQPRTSPKSHEQSKAHRSQSGQFEKPPCSR